MQLSETPVHDCARHAWQWLSHLSGASTKRNARIRRPFILMYHGVDGQTNRVEDLERQLIYLRRHFGIVALDDLLDRSGDDEQPAAVVVTFDDGLRNNCRNVVPLLVKHNIPATFFVCPALVDSGAWLWNHESRARLESLSDKWRRLFFLKYGIASNRVDDAVEWMKTLPLADREEVADYIRSLSPSFIPTVAQHRLYDVMNWNDVESLPDLVTVGSHTNTHAVLTSLGAEDLVREVADSKRRLEARLQRPVDYFCYPNGALNADIVGEVRKHYKAAVTVDTGHVAPDDDPYLLKRVAASPNMGISAFSWSIHRSSQ